MKIAIAQLNAVIGDMDSAELSDLKAAGRNAAIYKSDDQDTTDFEKALFFVCVSVRA